MKKQEWIAVVQRGGCSFSSKIQLSTKLGAIGIIIIDDNPRNLNPILMNTLGK